MIEILPVLVLLSHGMLKGFLLRYLTFSNSGLSALVGPHYFLMVS